MPVRQLYGVLVLALGISAHTQAQAQRITLRDATSRALATHPEIRIAASEVAAARGEVVTARVLAPNPAFALELGPARNSDTTFRNLQWGFSQPIELGGKRRWRSRSAQARLDAAELRLTRKRALVAWRVAQTYALALVADDRRRTAVEADSVGAALRTAAQERLALGAGTQLELNVAAAAAARDRRVRLDAERQHATALFLLRAAIGALPTDSLVPTGELPRIDLPAGSADSLVQLAFTRRPDYRAMLAEGNAADASLGFARSLRWPDPEIGVSRAREEDLNIRLLSVAVPIPFWNRGHGERLTASALVTRSRLAADSARRAIEHEVRDAHQALTRTLASREAFDRDVIETLSENLALALESFRSGKISLFAYNQIRRELVEARLTYLDVLAEAIERRYALALALGEPLESIDGSH